MQRSDEPTPHETAMLVPSLAETLVQRWLRSGTKLGDRYRPVRVLGQGGMGVVVHAIDERLGRDVALKWLRPEFARDPMLAQRFASEAALLARVHHPNVVQILDIVEANPAAGDEQVIYYVMEFLPGATLSSVMRSRGRMPFAQAYDVLLQTASALAAVHRVGVVHRDVKPSNLLLAELSPGAWHLTLIDFGIALSSGAPRVTRPGELVGTLPYMAPEQFAGTALDPRTDVYGWGVLALELLCAVSPMELVGPESLAGAPLRQAAGPALERARVQKPVRDIVRRCLETQPDDRWRSMDEVHAQLRELDDGGSPTLIYHRSDPQLAAVLTASSSGRGVKTTLLDGSAAAGSASLAAATVAEGEVGSGAMTEPMSVVYATAAAASGSHVAPRRRGASGSRVAIAVAVAACVVAAGLGALWLQQRREPLPVVREPAASSADAAAAPVRAPGRDTAAPVITPVPVPMPTPPSAVVATPSPAIDGGGSTSPAIDGGGSTSAAAGTAAPTPPLDVAEPEDRGSGRTAATRPSKPEPRAPSTSSSTLPSVAADVPATPPPAPDVAAPKPSPKSRTSSRPPRGTSARSNTAGLKDPFGKP